MPRSLVHHLVGHQVFTVPQVGWAGLKNGELLRRVDGNFDVFITGDQSLQFQQNLSTITFGIVVVAAPDNRVETFVGIADKILLAAESVVPGHVATVAT